MKDKIKDGIYFAYYGGLLNDHQREIMRLYFDCDMSLSEISEVSGTTRQAVRDIIVRCTAKLNEYETRIGLVGKILKITSSIEVMKNNSVEGSEQEEILTKILSEIKEI